MQRYLMQLTKVITYLNLSVKGSRNLRHKLPCLRKKTRECKSASKSAVSLGRSSFYFIMKLKFGIEIIAECFEH